MNEGSAFPEQPENKFERIHKENYLAGILDGCVSTEQSGRTSKLYCKTNDPALWDFLLETFGGTINKNGWSLSGYKRILEIYSGFSQEFKYTLLKKPEFYSFGRLLRGYNQGDSKVNKLYNDYKEAKEDKNPKIRLLGFTAHHLVGVFDSGRGSIHLEPPGDKTDPRGTVHLQLASTRYNYLELLVKVLGGSTTDRETKRRTILQPGN